MILLRFRLRLLRFDEVASSAKLVRLPSSRFGFLQPRVGAELAFDKVNIAPLPSITGKKEARCATCALASG
jgi:hypothetical protein